MKLNSKYVNFEAKNLQNVFFFATAGLVTCVDVEKRRERFPAGKRARRQEREEGGSEKIAEPLLGRHQAGFLPPAQLTVQCSYRHVLYSY